MIQPMPELTAEQHDALRDDIKRNGVLVPIVVDQCGRVLDGHNRSAIAAELGIEVPREVRPVADDAEALDLAVALNCARRHLTREQVREVIAGELRRRPEDSDRSIARRVGCSPSTVGAVRKPAEASNLDTPAMSRAEAEERTAEINTALQEARGALYMLVGNALVNNISVPEVIGALTMARLRFEGRAGRDPDIQAFWSEYVYDYVIQVTAWDATREQFPPHPDAAPTAEERAMLIDGIVMVGAQEHPADLEPTS